MSDPSKTGTKTPTQVVRTSKSWLVYLLLSLYMFCLSVPGPINGYLREEFQLNYLSSSMHVSAFALGLLLTGLLGGGIVRRTAPWKVMAIGALGLGAGALLLSFAGSPLLTLAGLFVMGLVGTLILSVYPAILEDEMGAASSVGITEANTIGSILSSLAPLSVGFLASRALDWRIVVIFVGLLSLALGLWLLFTWARHSAGIPNAAQPELAPARGSLPARYWLLWTALVLGVSIEFCTIYWGADFSAKALGLQRDLATQSVSIFLVGMIIGRFVGSRLLQKISPRAILVLSITLAVAGFTLYASALSPALGLIGMALLGLGAANFYTTILSLAIKAAGEQKALAGARATIASGMAIFFLPLLLGSLAGRIGIRSAYTAVGVLFVPFVLFLLLAQRGPQASRDVSAVDGSISE